MVKRSRQTVAEVAPEEVAEEAEEQEETQPRKKEKKMKKAKQDVAQVVDDVGEQEKSSRPKSGKKKQAAVAEAEEEAEEEVVSKKRRKESKAEQPKAKRKDKKESVEEAAEVEAPLKKAKKAKKANAAEAEPNDEDEVGEKAAAEEKTKASASEPADGNLTVFVGGIPWGVTKEGLQKDFEECGEVVLTDLFTDRDGNSKGIALITFADEAGVQKALEYDGEDYGGRSLSVKRSEKPAGGKGEKGKGKGGKGKGKSQGAKFEAFVKNVSSHTQEPQFKEHFAKCGHITELSMPTRATGKSKGFGWVTFSDQEALDKALALDGSELLGFKLVVEKARVNPPEGKGKGKGKDAKGKGKGKLSSEFEVFCSNLSYETNEAGLREYFGECGEVERLHMPTKVAGKCMGFAWVTFKTKEGMRKAIDLAYEEFEGRRIKIEKSGQHRDDKGDAAADE